MQTVEINKAHQRSPLYEIQDDSLKRVFDCAFSLVALLFLSPLFLAIALIIRYVTGGQAIYVQPRLGRGGRIFRCYKFRTMYNDAEMRLEEILKNNPQFHKEWLRKQKLVNDPRVFPFGKWLRQTSLDELPQFWNVLRGDLSIVGPRPYMVTQRGELGKKGFKILSVRPGITGLWQTSGRSRTTFQERIALDAQYIDRRSFFFDLYLIIKTLFQLLLRTDAY